MGLYSIRVAGQALALGVAQTLVQVHAPASKRIRVVEWGISFDGVDPAEAPVLLDLMRQASQGTSSTFVPIRWDEAEPAAIGEGRTAFTAEPTTGSVLQSYQVTPNSGLLVMQYMPGREPVVAADGRFGLRALAAAAVNATAYVVFEE